MKTAEFLPKSLAYCKHYGQRWVASTTGMYYWICQYCGKRVSISKGSKGFPQEPILAGNQSDFKEGEYVPIPPYPVKEK